ncbi:hypothetical protein PIB30_098042 [Stylosanthes scabra]|uniref:Uncharacterized protein n=1 Tax=Stylosanthes scabra TaxID=79078 RepID=A0ABU6ZV84_9FABA|nr:hypothetical protein [Stylosanthes scabra]
MSFSGVFLRYPYDADKHLLARQTSLSINQGRAVAAAGAVSLSRKLPFLASNFGRAHSGSASASTTWISGALALPAAGFLERNHEVTEEEEVKQSSPWRHQSRLVSMSLT